MIKTRLDVFKDRNSRNRCVISDIFFEDHDESVELEFNGSLLRVHKRFINENTYQ